MESCVVVFKRTGVPFEMYYEGLIQGICIGLIDKDKPDLGYDCEHFDTVTVYRLSTTLKQFNELKDILIKIFGADRLEFHVMGGSNGLGTVDIYSTVLQTVKLN